MSISISRFILIHDVYAIVASKQHSLSDDGVRIRRLDIRYNDKSVEIPQECFQPKCKIPADWEISIPSFNFTVISCSEHVLELIEVL